MRDWPGINPATEPDPIRRDKDAKIDFFLRDLTRGMGRIQRGELPDGSGTTLGVTDHGALTGLDDDDHLQYLLLAGRDQGQRAIGDPAVATSSTTLLELVGFDNPPIAGTSGIATRSAMLRLNDGAWLWTDTLVVAERNTSYLSGVGFEIDTGLGFVNTSNYGGMTLNGMSSSLRALTVDHNASSVGTITSYFKARASQTGDLMRFVDSADAQLSGFTAAGAHYHISGATNGYVWTSDANGVGSWQVAGAGSLVVHDHSGASTGGSDLNPHSVTTFGTGATGGHLIQSMDLATEIQVMARDGDDNIYFGSSEVAAAKQATGRSVYLQVRADPVMRGYWQATDVTRVKVGDFSAPAGALHVEGHEDVPVLIAQLENAQTNRFLECRNSTENASAVMAGITAAGKWYQEDSKAANTLLVGDANGVGTWTAAESIIDVA